MIKIHRYSPNVKTAALCLILLLSLFFTVHSARITDFAKDALRLCAESVIPSLFPFMVLSAIASKAASVSANTRSSRGVIIIPILLGALCGFPVGAATTAFLYKNNAIPKRDAEYLCALCNNTGPAFIIGVIGSSFWGSSSLGILFYVCQLLSAATVFGICVCLFSIRRKPLFSSNVKTDFKSSSLAKQPFSANAVNTLCREFCSAVAGSAVSVIQICGYIVFFKVVCDIIGYLIPSGSRFAYTVISCILEFTSGSAAAAELGGTSGIALCGFTIGFSGLSVMAQSTGIMSNAGLSTGPMFRLKFIIGLLNGAICLVAYRIFDFSQPTFSGIDNVRYAPNPLISLIILIAAATAFAVLFVHTRKQK